MTLGSSSMVGGWGTLGLHGRLHEFVKRALLQQLVSPGATVCDLFCGRGTDTSNWAQARIGNYIGIDLSASALEEAKDQWEKHCHPFSATFQELDPCIGNLEILQDAGLPADIVTCFAHLQDYFASEDMVRLLLRNIVSLLKPGGYFFGTTPDSSTIWYKYQKAVEEAMKIGSLRVHGTLPRVRSSLYTITFEDDRFQFFGSKYQLRFVDGLPAQTQQLIHFPSFIRLAEEVGLEYIEIQNLTEFYDDYRVPFASTLQSSCKNLLDQKGQPMVDSRGKLSTVAIDVLSLYSTFIFKKSTRIVDPPLYFDFQLNSERHFDRGVLVENSPKSSLSPTMLFGFELTPENSVRDSSPRVKAEEFSLSSGEEYLFPTEDLFDFVIPKEESPMYAIEGSTSDLWTINSLHPILIEDTPNSDQFFPLDALSTDAHNHLRFQEIDYIIATKKIDLEERDRNTTILFNDELEYIGEQQEQGAIGVMQQVGDNLDQCPEEEKSQEEKMSAIHEEVATNLQKTMLPRKDHGKGKKKKKTKTTRFCSNTTTYQTMPRQTCSMNCQSEVEEVNLDPRQEDLTCVPPPFLFYQRKKRMEIDRGDDVVQDASFSANTGSLRELRPRRAISVGAPKLASRPWSSKVDQNKIGSNNPSIHNEEDLLRFNNDGMLTTRHGGRVQGKAKGNITLKNNQLPFLPVSLDRVANGQRSTRSCSRNTIQGSKKGANSESNPKLTTRITRMQCSNLQRSF